MSIRTRIAGIASAVGATKLAAKLSEETGQKIVATPEPEGIPSQPEVKRLPRTRETWYQRWLTERPQRLRAYASYKGGKHHRGVPAHIQQQYQFEAEVKRQGKDAKRARDHSLATYNNPCLKG
ncbi:hypothetical protein RIVERRIDER_32 [Xanthomonas phage RiverRider]|uniref:Uncharacterized protein n=1 Tax=Xanthomonas phage RiverRider TaxID=2108116 RepID=A0A2P1JUT3_9CAUD|nr:hypothetical protein HWB58_gp32 [Xanthomonas phage RiverRider]AVO23120.1 hypothetical protein RIVERRIDER_32 [Xanthomonas phage RiverRider]